MQILKFKIVTFMQLLDALCWYNTIIFKDKVINIQHLKKNYATGRVQKIKETLKLSLLRYTEKTCFIFDA